MMMVGDRILNFWKINEGAKVAVRRFPVSLAFTLALSVQVICYAWMNWSPDALTFFLSVGMLVALIQHLWAEDNVGYALPCMGRSVRCLAFWLLPLLLLGADSIVLHYADDINLAVQIAQSGGVAALLVVLCFIPFLRERDDCKSWNFVFRLVSSAAIALTVGGVMCGGISFLYYGAAELFGFEVEEDIVFTYCILCLISLPILLFHIRIPSGEEKHNAQLPKNRFVLGVTKFLFIPLAVLYILVLYAYGLKILFTWTLPEGMLATMVSVMMLGVILITFLMYPYRVVANGESRVPNGEWGMVQGKWFMRIVPYAVVPLIFLMSVGLARRFMDYGITANRLYVLTLNLWFYAVAIGLIVCKARRIHWISISFAALVVLTSCHPWNFNSAYRSMMLDRYDAITKKYNLNMSEMTETVLRQSMQMMTEKESRRFYDVLQNSKDFNDRIKQECSHLSLYLNYEMFMQYNSLAVGSESSNDMEYLYDGAGFHVPQGYESFTLVSESQNPMHVNVSDADGENGSARNGNDSTFVYSHDTFGDFVIAYRNLDNERQYVFRNETGDAVLVVEHLKVYSNRLYSISGCIFHH